MEDIGEEFIESDDEDQNSEQYNQLHAAISQLDNVKRIRPAKRNELGSSISEFHINQKNEGKLNAADLAGVLEKKKLKDTKVNKKAKKVAPHLKTIPKPLEKIASDRIKRKIGLEIVKEQLSSWDAVVENHRVTDHMVFPLNAPKFTVQSGKEFFSKFKQTELEKELNAVLHGEQQPVEEEEQDEFPLTLEEIMERRKELAGIRARQSYREAKAFRQSKIKSKKYHRIQKREKIRQQLKDFEVLQKTDPEEALKKLEELEKSRALERATLKHRSTGKWAQNLAVRAKYDQESRKVLAEQLAISKEATQKLKINDSSDEDEENASGVPAILKDAMQISASNPWSLEVSSDVNSFISGFRKYWTENNKMNSEESNKDKVASTIEPEISTEEADVPPAKDPAQVINMDNSIVNIGASDKWTVSPALDDSLVLKKTNFDIDDAFDAAEEKLVRKISDKFKILSGKIKPVSKKLRSKRKTTKLTPSLKMKKSRWQVERVQIDKELVDTRMEKEDTVLVDIPKSAHTNLAAASSAVDIDPKKFMVVKRTSLNTPLPDEITGGDDDNDEQQEQLIMEAFADDNIADFKEAKAAAEAETKAPEVVTELPGWGSWGGVGVVPGKMRKRRRFMKMPELPARKDATKPDVIINENPNPLIKKHMVKEVPFPFTSVDAFESNIRAPVSRDWVPELAHRELIKPSVVTKQGAIIEPLSDDILIRNKQKPRSVFKAKLKKKTTIK